MTNERQEAIKELVQKENISDQRQLVELLLERHGIETNQAVVSRELRKLNVVKKVVNGSLCYELPNTSVSIEILRLALIDIEYNEALIVIKTHPGIADFVGDFIDKHDDLGVLGCLSGENVVFVTPKSIKEIKGTYKKLCEKLHFKKKDPKNA